MIEIVSHLDIDSKSSKNSNHPLESKRDFFIPITHIDY